MSTLQRIRYDLKGHVHNAALSGVDLVTGPNGSGKSTFLGAISAGLRGLAQSPGDLEKLYIGPERTGSVELTFDTGVIVRPDLSKVADKDSKRADYDAERIAGKHLVRWDLADFATISETNREKLLRSICGNIQATSLKLPESPLMPLLLRVERLEQDAGVWLERSLKWVGERFTEANAAQKTAIEGAKAAGEAAEKEAPPGTLSSAKAELDRLSREVGELRAQARTAQRDAEHVRATEARRDRLAQQHASLEEELGRVRSAAQKPLMDLGEARTAHMRAVEAASAKLAACKAQGGVAVRLHDAVRGLKNEVSSMEGELSALKQQDGRTCAHCGHADPLAILPQIQKLRAELEDKKAEMDDKQEDLDFADKVYARLDAEHKAAVDAEFAALDALRANEGRHDLRAGFQTRATQIEADMQRVATEMNDAITTAPMIFQAEAQLFALEEQLKAAALLHDQHVRCAERGKVHQEALVKRTKAEADFEAVKKLKADLQALQAEVAAKAWGPLQTAANDLLSAMGSPLRAAVKSAGDFGATDARRDGGYASFWALSDAERATVGAALALAMVRLSSAPWRGLVIDGLEKMDAGTLDGFLAGVVEAEKQGWLHNFIGALVADEELPEMNGIRQHWMGAA